VEHGHLIHWSHMLAVHPEYRNHGIGRRLKEYQRDVLVRLGVEWMYWTFDPLVARNAHLNLTRLGARVREYVPDMYGDTGSELHSFGTDRFVVSWPVAARRAPASSDGAAVRRAARSAPVVNRAPGEDREGGVAVEDASTVRIRVPSDVEAMQVGDLKCARAWRASTREAFVRYLKDGYSVSGFYCEGFDRCYYVLARPRNGGKMEASGD
ncbi:MAG: GNAT family N-acetyltransferase, partial [Longimicrobiales bacterium]